ncbi:hypothetical protein [Pseudolysinimonas sp.]|uniref:hypothetical protein n=1 Tax=Pseudolysinimonas sp. TaxID=2680009 RepID=UPI003F822A3A
MLDDAPMFTTRISTSDPHHVEFVNEAAPRGQREQGITVTAGMSTIDPDVKLVMIDTQEGTGRVRVVLNDDTLYDGDPETTPDRTPEEVVGAVLQRWVDGAEHAETLYIPESLEGRARWFDLPEDQLPLLLDIAREALR